MKPSCKLHRHSPSAPGGTRKRSLIVLGAALCILLPEWQAARAADATDTYFHVQQVTTGCQNPAAVRILADPDQTTAADPRRLKSIRTSGRCVTITPRSKWSFLWRENDVAMMSYAGKIGPPGSYYIRVDDLRDPDGRTLDDIQPAHPDIADQAAASDNPADVAATPPAPASELRAASAETPKIAPPPSGGQITAQAAQGKSIDDLIANNGGRAPPAGDMPPPVRSSGDRLEMSPRVWVPAACLALFVVALGGIVAVRRRPGQSDKHLPALETALDEVRAHAPALRAARAESTQPDRYGTVHADGWEREKTLFVNSRILPRLRAAGYQNMPPALLHAIDAEIESCGNSVAGSSPFGAYAGLDHAGSSVTPDIDPGLSLYATRCTSLLQDAGWSAEPEPATTGKAVDILAERDGRTLLLQCKGDGSPVGVEAVQEVFNRKDRRKADIAAIVTHAPFTRAAQQLASANGVHAVHEDGLMQLIR